LFFSFSTTTASEVGMGKSLVCIALVLANPGSYKRMSVQQFTKATAPLGTVELVKPHHHWCNFQQRSQDYHATKASNENICKAVCLNDLEKQLYKIKTTVISTTNTIVGQWYDEIKKFAPELNVKVHHGSYKSSPDFFNPSVTNIQDVDSKCKK
jgi:SNF2 family DNA or RNA helicase